MRRSPIQHQVRGHDRGNSQVQPYMRGEGYPRSREHVVVKATDEPERVLDLGDEEIEIFKDLDAQANQGLDLWIELHRLETQLIEESHTDYDTARVLLSQVREHLHYNRDKFQPDFNLDVAYQQADTGVIHHDFEEITIGFSAMKQALQDCHRESWVVKEE